MGVFTFFAHFALACQNCCPQNKMNNQQNISRKRTKTTNDIKKFSTGSFLFVAPLYRNYMDFC